MLTSTVYKHSIDKFKLMKVDRMLTVSTPKLQCLQHSLDKSILCVVYDRGVELRKAALGTWQALEEGTRFRLDNLAPLVV